MKSLKTYNIFMKIVIETEYFANILATVHAFCAELSSFITQKSDDK